MQSSSSSSTSLLTSSSSPKNWESGFGKLSSSFGFSGSVPSLPKKSSKSPKPSSTSTTMSSQSSSSTSSRSSMSSVPSTSTSARSSVLPPPKDYEASFGHLSSSYGFGGSVPSLPPKSQKQPKRSVSPSSSPQPTVVRPSTGKDFETSFAQLSSSYGFGGSSVSSMSSRSFTSAVEVPKDGEQPVVAGSVGVSYNAIVAEGIVIRDAAVTRQVTASVNVVIEQDPDIPKPRPSPIHGFFDGRRVMSLNQVSIEGQVPAQST
ncbi:hypothetical protein GALMADRAFT_157779 [Galerina marginata CBS 339.88]|uniref:Uncharacterized protein n=1 Tax=Galerina marginata (strain CBS 339.88) TaxID=685588 RepID=A0A067T4P3_GALM3|nr:hypothetical protein GALMADRAFT_157779 [Galerina marginata CBS 339.88]